MAESPEAPGWPVANIDFDAAHKAAKAGKLEQHLAELEKPAAPADAETVAIPAAADK
jgi:hypothetical protein